MTGAIRALLESHQTRSEVQDHLSRLQKPIVLYVGAGISAGEGLYDPWSQLMDRICQACGMAYPVPDLHDMEVAAEAKKRNPRAYEDTIREVFASFKGKMQIVAGHLPNFKSPMIITTNYDESISHALSSHRIQHDVKDFTQITSDSAKGILERPCVYHIHGLIRNHDDPLNIILSKDEYDLLYAENSSMKFFLADVFRAYDIVFLGVSFKDVFIFEILRNVHQMQLAEVRKNNRPLNSLPKRYALMGLYGQRLTGQSNQYLDLTYTEQTTRQLAAMGIKPIWYDGGHNHQELLTIFQQWFPNNATQSVASGLTHSLDDEQARMVTGNV